MANHDDLNHNPIVINFVDDAVVADSNSHCLAAAEFLGAGRSWRPGQIADGFDDAFLEGRRNFRQRLLRRLADVNRGVHRLALVLICRTASSKGTISSGRVLALS
jgi:hypothetical protein